MNPIFLILLVTIYLMINIDLNILFLINIQNKLIRFIILIILVLLIITG